MLPSASTFHGGDICRATAKRCRPKSSSTAQNACAGLQLQHKHISTYCVCLTLHDFTACRHDMLCCRTKRTATDDQGRCLAGVRSSPSRFAHAAAAAAGVEFVTEHAARRPTERVHSVSHCVSFSLCVVCVDTAPVYRYMRIFVLICRLSGARAARVFVCTVAHVMLCEHECIACVRV